MNMKSFKQLINETSLSRIWQHFTTDKTIVILTAFRKEQTKKDNINNNKFIGTKLYKAGFGFFYVDGHWIENKGTDREIAVKEDSIFAISEPEQSNELISLAHKLATKYNQDAIFVKTKDEVYLLYKDGKKEKLTGGLKPGKIADFYTKLRKGRRRTDTFVFESVVPQKGYFGKFIEYIKSNK